MSAYGCVRGGLRPASWTTFDYPAWADYYLALLERGWASGRRRCATARAARARCRWSLRGGASASPAPTSPSEMLAVAAGKARAAGVRAMFVREDMCALRLPTPVDALVCGCDGVNYLLGEARVQARSSPRRGRRSARAGRWRSTSRRRTSWKRVLGGNFFRRGAGRRGLPLVEPVRRASGGRSRMDLTFFRRDGGRAVPALSRDARPARAHGAGADGLAGRVRFFRDSARSATGRSRRPARTRAAAALRRQVASEGASPGIHERSVTDG